MEQLHFDTITVSIKNNNKILVNETLEPHTRRNDILSNGVFQTNERMENLKASLLFGSNFVSIGLRKDKNNESAFFEGKFNGDRLTLLVVIIPQSNNEYKYRITIFTPLREVA